MRLNLLLSAGLILTGAAAATHLASGTGMNGLETSSDSQRKADAIRQILENPVGEAFLQSVAPDMWSRFANARDNGVACAVFAPDTPEWYVTYMMDLIGHPLDDGSRYQPAGSQWGSGGSVTLYYSFPPDGTDLSGFASETNQMHSRWSDAAAFGSDAAWKDLFAQAFDAWSQVTGNTYIEIADDGAAWKVSDGPFDDPAQDPNVPATLLRGDIRIVSASVDGLSGTLAFNFYPSSGGDMLMDSDDLPNYLNPTNNYRFLRNVIIHEHGHGVGLAHEIPSDNHAIMQPFITTSVDGLQHDDRLGAYFKHNDRFSPNNSLGDATSLTAQGFGFGPTYILENLAITSGADVDHYKFTIGLPTELDIVVFPEGSTYQSGPQGGTATSFNSKTQADLMFEMYDAFSNPIAGSASAAIGAPEFQNDIALTSPGEYYIVVSRTSGTGPQEYSLQLTLNDGNVPGDLSGDGLVTGADLGVLLSNWGTPGNGDINGDGTVDGQDLGLLLSNWSS